MARLVVHVGYPKTATTTFQMHVFGRHPEIEYLGKFIPSFRYVDERLFPAIDDLMTSDSCRYKGTETLRSIIEKYRVRCERRVLLLSSESFLHVTAGDLGVVAERIRAAFWPCRIVLSLRNQLDMMRSFYGMHGRFGQYVFVMKEEAERFTIPVSPDAWLTYGFRAPGKSLVGILHYHDVVQRYFEIFGRDNVGVFLFEEFASDRAAYVNTLCDFLGVDATVMLTLLADKHEHPNLTRGELAYYRLRSWLGTGFAFQPATMDRSRLSVPIAKAAAKADVTFGAAWETRIADLYREGNRALQAATGLPLDRYGYPT